MKNLGNVANWIVQFLINKTLISLEYNRSYLRTLIPSSSIWMLMLMFFLCTWCRLKHRWEEICAFQVFPYKFQTSLQFFELADDYIQQEIRKPLMQTTCTVIFLYWALLKIFFFFPMCWRICLYLYHTHATHNLLSFHLFFLKFLV